MTIILISGAPGTGKSTLARGIAKKLGIYQVLGTDSIREILRYAIPKRISPSLHTSAIKINEPYKDYPKEIAGFMKQADDVKPGIEAIINRSIKENKDIILEGIHLIPGEYEVPERVKFVHFVVCLDEANHEKYMLAQGDDRSSYKLENFQKARAFQNYLIENSRNEESAKIVENNESIEDVLNAIQDLL